MTIAVRDLSIGAVDALPLRATLFEPASPRQAVVISGATAVPRGFYRGFAEYLARCGAAVVTYDYRGSGLSPQESRRSPARMRDWGELDFPGVVAWTKARYPAMPLHAAGHSFGGHAFLMAPNNAAIDRAMTVATQMGYWRYCAPVERYRVWTLLNVLAPSALLALGYVPGSKLGLGEDLAPGIMHEWRRWCNSPGYFFDDPTMAATLANARAFTAPTLLVRLSDDTWATQAGVDAYAAHVAGAEPLTLVPADYGLPAIGHFDFFRSRNGPAVWPIAARYFGLVEAA